jgi:DNA-directed RNA polymerase II subunit RPB2
MDEWDILDVHFRDNRYPFTKHHLDSYRQFLNTIIPSTIRAHNPITMVKLDPNTGAESLRVEVTIGQNDISVDRPTMLDENGKPVLLTPHEARLRNLTYATKIYADVDVKYKVDGKDYDRKQFPYTLIGVIPLMLHSDQCMLQGQGSRALRAMNECQMDGGGYFIVDGKEKVIVSQERITTNRLFITETKDTNYSMKAYIRCTTETSLSPRTVEFYVVNTSCFENENADCSDEPVKKDLKHAQGAIMVSVPGILGSIPLTWLFRVFGIETDKSIVESICGSIDEASSGMLDFIRPSLVHGVAPYVKNQVLYHTAATVFEALKPRVYYNSVEHVKTILMQDVFPHIERYQDKGKYLGYLVSQIAKTSLGLMPFSDRDSYAFKRVDISGFLLGQLFQETYEKLKKFIRDNLDQEYHYGFWRNTKQIEYLLRKDNLHRIISPIIISDTFQRSLKGMWGPQSDDPDQGLVQDLSRISYIGFLSHLRRVNMPLDRSIKVTDPHRLHSQQWGIMCPFESPDGASIGYLKNFALMTQITFSTSPSHLYKLFDELEVIPLASVPAVVSGSKDTIKVLLNGTYYGVTLNPRRMVDTIRLYRRNGLVNPFISVAWNIKDNEIRIQTEAGRPCRPLLILEDGKLRIPQSLGAGVNWFTLVFGTMSKDLTESKFYDEAYLSPYSMMEYQNKTEDEIRAALTKTAASIEYLDIEEENTMLIAMKRDDITSFHTHAEIHPSTAFSVVTQIVPFPNHNQAPRVYFHAAQSKQAQGIYATNFTKRFDTSAYIQHYPQRRIIDTRGSHYVGNNMMPNGTNLIVAIMTHTGFNQEDSIIINKGAIDRGCGWITAYKTMTATEKVLNPNERLMFANPLEMRSSGKQVEGISHANYSLLDKDGIIPNESYIPKGQSAAVLGMVNVRQVAKKVNKGVLTQKVIEEQYHDVSLFTDTNHYGRVDKVFVSKQTSGNPNRIAKIRFRKVRRPELGDKHSSSHGQKGVIGMVLQHHDMPFTKDGIVPDIIINPHAIPTRMTIGHLIETVFAKVCCMDGSYGDGTVFIPFDKDRMFDGLASHGYEKYGNEVLYEGRTGRQLSTEIFMGPIYYYRLKHMVADKMQARGTGPKVLLTHQPTSGRSKSGGLRIGEMERDVLLAYGVSQFAKESMMEKSDKFKWGVCRACGVIAKYAPKRGIVGCLSCKSQNIAVVETPYSFKLLIQELEAIGLETRLYTQPIQDETSDEESATDSDSSSSKSSYMSEDTDIEEMNGGEDEAGEAEDAEAVDNEEAHEEGEQAHEVEDEDYDVEAATTTVGQMLERDTQIPEPIQIPVQPQTPVPPPTPVQPEEPVPPQIPVPPQEGGTNTNKVIEINMPDGPVTGSKKVSFEEDLDDGFDDGGFSMYGGDDD